MNISIIYKNFEVTSDWPIFEESETVSHNNTHDYPIPIELIEKRKNDVIEFIQNDDYFVKTIWKENEKIGIVIFGLKPSKVIKVGFLFNIYIKKEHRNSQIGEKVIHDLIAFSKDRGFKNIELFVGANNLPAKRLYEKTGFISKQIAMELKL